LIPITILTSVDTNEALVIINIDWGITTKYNGIYVISSILKFEVLA